MYLFNVTSQLAVQAEDSTIVTTHNYNSQAQTSDYTFTNVLLVPANSEVSIPLPGINKIKALLITSDQVFDVSLIDDDTTSDPTYTGVFGNLYYRTFTAGVLYDRLVIKASTTETVIRLTVAGVETI
jgi:hypothetical protein